MKSSRPVALVVGAAGGIGRAVVGALASTHRVVASDRQPASPRARTRLVTMDVTLERQVRRTRDLILAEHGRIDLLVFAAAVVRRGPLLMSPTQDLREMMEVNVIGAARCLRIFAEPMIRQRGGRIILLGSVAARRALPGAGGYAASKAALESLGRTAALELAPFGVSVISLSPGWVQTRLTQGDRKAFAQIPLRRAARPSEVAEVVAALANLETSYLTGVSVLLDGGLTA